MPHCVGESKEYIQLQCIPANRDTIWDNYWIVNVASDITGLQNINMVQLNLKCVPSRLMRAKLQKLMSMCVVAHNFDMCAVHTANMHTSDTYHELALGLPHYTCGVA